MRKHYFICVAFLMMAAVVRGQTTVYRPFGSWVDPASSSFEVWEINRQSQLLRRADAMSGQPRLAGLRPRNLELLQDAVVRKAPAKARSPVIARKMILRMKSHQAGTNFLNGAMAEAMFVDRNAAEGWRYVKNPNATQHDFTRPGPNGGLQNVQVKFHVDGRPAQYAADMTSDWSATKFAVPDDHVEPLKAYLRDEYNRLKMAGNPAAADEVGRKLGRVRPIGASSTEITAGVRQSARHVRQEQTATYVSFGASLVLALGPTAWGWAHGDLAANQAMYRGTRALSLLGVGIGTDVLLANVRQGAMRGTVRGNVIVGTALLVTETTWLLYEHGWSRAFSDPQFYESLGGSVTGLAFGLIASGATVAWVPGPGWVVGGTAIATGVVAGTVGYFGGRSAVHTVFEMVAPEKLQLRERERLTEVTKGIEGRIQELQRLRS